MISPMIAVKTNALPATLIAPCGMNCRLCIAYGRGKMPCPGCRGDDRVKSKTRIECRIKNCEKLGQGKARYCSGCDGFPCDRLIHLDKRYRIKYGMSMIDNLVNIKKVGIRQFIRNEKDKWTCPECGEIICVHKPQCPTCGHKWRQDDLGIKLVPGLEI
ncbi:MAG: DUF3795 domain-containing protein [Syntrophales bacterium]|nr:DUF3795 domain-containing protein [Syntrophales bacterium]